MVGAPVLPELISAPNDWVVHEVVGTAIQGCGRNMCNMCTLYCIVRQGYESDGEDSEGAESGGESAGAAAAADPAGQALAAVQITDGGEGQAGPGGAEQGRQGQESSAAGAASTSGGGEGGDGGGDAVDMDSLLEQVLLQALHKSVKDTGGCSDVGSGCAVGRGKGAAGGQHGAVCHAEPSPGQEQTHRVE